MAVASRKAVLAGEQHGGGYAGVHLERLPARRADCHVAEGDRCVTGDDNAVGGDIRVIRHGYRDAAAADGENAIGVREVAVSRDIEADSWACVRDRRAKTQGYGDRKRQKQCEKGMDGLALCHLKIPR